MKFELYCPAMTTGAQEFKRSKSWETNKDDKQGTQKQVSGSPAQN